MVRYVLSFYESVVSTKLQKDTVSFGCSGEEVMFDN